ncbi:Glycosyl hydrolase family 17 protein [Musa troglodytarum]|uniref:Glycosyl hydrolase family 17 protein n=1 Tax=Musa troglodytarum TaxID=320322 RepID=A0A9E7IDH1_9LILI|nr:Glycosyl hydrolase family 17 protein [Musa troglodytarum]
MTLLFGFLFYKENGETMNRIHVMRLPPCPNTTKKKQQRQYTGGGTKAIESFATWIALRVIIR